MNCSSKAVQTTTNCAACCAHLNCVSARCALVAQLWRNGVVAVDYDNDDMPIVTGLAYEIQSKNCVSNPLVVWLLLGIVRSIYLA